jgi:hypothetical protein
VKISVELKEEMFIIYPNRWNRNVSESLRTLLRIISKKTEFREKEKSSVFPKEWSMFTEKLPALECRQKRLEKKLDSMFEESRKIPMHIQTRLGNWECETTGTEDKI